MRHIGRLLVWLSGARPEILERFPADRAKYVGIGAAIVITGAVASVSMTFALNTALAVPLAAALPSALAWGIAIMSLDRWLVVSLQRQHNRWRYFTLAVPRILMAVLFGSIISTPILLQVFQPEIARQVIVIQEQRINEFFRTLPASALSKRITADKARVVDLDRIIAGGGEPSTNPFSSPLITGLNQQLDAAKTTELNSFDLWQCELSGVSPKGTKCSGVVGNGPLAEAAHANYVLAATEVRTLQSQINTAVHQQVSSQGATRSRQVAQANAELRPAELQLNVDTNTQARLVAAFVKKNEASAGLLLRLQALSTISSQNASVNAARWLLFLLFTTIECLPVLVKVLLNLGPENAYEHALALEEQKRLRVAAEQTAQRQKFEILEVESEILALEQLQMQRDAMMPEVTRRAVAAELKLALAMLEEWETRQLDDVSKLDRLTTMAAPPVAPVHRLQDLAGSASGARGEGPGSSTTLGRAARNPTMPPSPGRATARARDDERNQFEAAPRPPITDRFMVAQLPARAPLEAEVHLVVRISADAAAPLEGRSIGLPGLIVDATGARVTIAVEAPRALLPAGVLEQVLWVPPANDSQAVYFTFLAKAPGLHRVRVTAYAGGTFLSELTLEVSVHETGPLVEAPAQIAPAAPIYARPGEVTLQVRSDGERYTFQLLAGSALFEPVAEMLAAEPGQAVERAIDALRKIARGSSGYDGPNARRWMHETGVGLWNEMVPRLIKEQFWDLRDRIGAFSIATSQDIIPWELLYPMSKRRDEGFLIEQFPVLRRVYGQQSENVRLADARYIVPDGSGSHAEAEIATLKMILRQDPTSPAVVNELSALMDLIDSGQTGLLHFACHNAFHPETGGSSVSMNGGKFVPSHLNTAVTRRSLENQHPLIFMNACRSAGAIPEYTQMMGWAQQFMAAGAGAFVGTLWAVRSDTASAFASLFYRALSEGQSLGEATRFARMSTSGLKDDPTWLAYTVYGDPAARAVLD